jgi:hypothetical protein
VHERIRQNYQNPPDTMTQQLMMKNESGFNRLAQAYFISQQDAGAVTRGYFVSDIQLMRDKTGSWPKQSKEG